MTSPDDSKFWTDTTTPSDPAVAAHMARLTNLIKQWCTEQGFQQTGVTHTDLGEHEVHLNEWLANGFSGEMHYMSEHGSKRSRPAELITDTQRAVSVRLDYLSETVSPEKLIASDQHGYIARYTLGRDYHKVIRQKLKRVWKQIESYLADHQLPSASGRVFTDSAPILEKAIAQQAGIGWIGKNTLVMNETAGSWFFLGEIFTNLPLDIDQPTASQHCGSCSSCIDICPTDAIVAPYQLDARKCISYLTIEYRGVIDEALRAPMGNRIFGCDDCQVFCPWNKFSSFTSETDFQPRHNLAEPELLELFSWSEGDFLAKTEGSAIRRTGYEGWQRNIAIALGNSEYSSKTIQALQNKLVGASDLVAEHVQWALDQQQSKEGL